MSKPLHEKTVEQLMMRGIPGLSLERARAMFEQTQQRRVDESRLGPAGPTGNFGPLGFPSIGPSGSFRPGSGIFVVEMYNPEGANWYLGRNAFGSRSFTQDIKLAQQFTDSSEARKALALKSESNSPLFKRLLWRVMDFRTRKPV